MSKALGFLNAMVAVVAAFMFVALPAQAQNVIEMNDRDGDGRLSPREFPGPPQGSAAWTVTATVSYPPRR
jgi:hypothetical protein